MAQIKKKSRSLKKHLISLIWIVLGAFLAALSIRMFLYPNKLIDGGVIGISLISARLLGDQYLPIFLFVINLPFIYLAYKSIRKTFVIQMSEAVLFFTFFLTLLQNCPTFYGDTLEVIVFGGALLGAGVGLMIRSGGCTDGTEILAILINRKTGFTVGQIVFVINIFIFGAYGAIFLDWHIALKSLMTYIVAFKVIDIVIAGLEEVKSVLVLTAKPKQVSKAVMHTMGLGLTIIPSFGGFSGEQRDILFVIVERLDLAEFKEIVLREDPTAFMAIQNLQEVAYGKHLPRVPQKRRRKIKKSLFS